MTTYHLKAKFTIVAELPDVVAIEDLNGSMSVTNDAERVVRYLTNIGLPAMNTLQRVMAR